MADKQNAAKTILSAVFPWLTAAATGFAGPLGGQALTALGNKLGVTKPNPTIEDVAAAYAGATPDQRLEAEKEEHDYMLKWQAAGFKQADDLIALGNADRDSARQMVIKTGDVWTPRLLAAFVVLAWSIVQFYIIPHAMMATQKVPDPSMVGILNRVLGTLDGALMLVLAFYFGSSSGSERKTDVMAAQAAQGSAN